MNRKVIGLIYVAMLLLSGCLPVKKTSGLGKKTVFDDPHFYYDKENYTLIRVNPETREEDIEKYLSKKSTVKTMSLSPPVERLKHTVERPKHTVERPKHIEGYDTPPKPKHIIRPIYPRKSLNEAWHGAVVLKMLIDSTGNVIIAKPIDIEKIRHLDKGGVLMVESALTALMKSEFEPAIHNGKPVRVWVTFPVRFVPNKDFSPNLVP